MSTGNATDDGHATQPSGVCVYVNGAFIYLLYLIYGCLSFSIEADTISGSLCDYPARQLWYHHYDSEVTAMYV